MLPGQVVMTPKRFDSTRPEPPPTSPQDGPNGGAPLPASPAATEKTTSPPPREKIGGARRYDVRSLLARGGMSTVHFAFDRVLQREVAIKRLTADYCSPVDVARFVAEAQITAQLDHPNIIPLYDLVLGDEPYFVMKLLGGKNLAEHLAMGPVPRDTAALDRLLGILLKVCGAIEFAHGRGIVHRDLKPKNVVLDREGSPYVMDWGLARILQSPDTANVSVTHAPDERDDGSGTAAYMAPEQSRPGWRAIGPWTDIFGIGTLLYEILTGRPPHVADTLEELRRLVARGEVAPPETHAPGAVPSELSKIVLIATAREPQHRYGSVEELRQEIEQYRRGAIG